MATQNFWASPNCEPKRQSRFLLNINGIPAWLAKKCEKPSFEIETTEHQYLNHTFNYPAGLKWNDIAVTLVDPVAPDAAATLMQILSDSGYRFPEDLNSTTTISKANAVAALGNVIISQIGADGIIVEEWELLNAFITSCKFGPLDYSSKEMSEVELTIKYDYARMSVAGVPAQVG